jgi:hypothetical protein
MSISQTALALYALMLEPARSDGVAARSDGVAAVGFCRDAGVLGVGWGAGSTPLGWESYQRRAIAHDGAVHPAVLELHDLPHGSLIWTRDPEREDFYLARVIGPWQYLYRPAALRAGIHNARPVRMVACESAAQVPKPIAHRFSGDWAIQRVYDEHTAWHSASLFAELDEDRDPARLTLDEILARCLSDEQVRHRVCRYLHRRCGYLRRPPLLQPMFGAWEYVLPARNGGRAIIRAGRGCSLVPRTAGPVPARAADRIFVFSPTGTYSRDRDRNVIELAYEKLVGLIGEEPSSLPRTFQRAATAALGPAGISAERRAGVPR